MSDSSFEEIAPVLEPCSDSDGEDEVRIAFPKEQYIAFDDGSFDFGWPREVLPAIIGAWKAGMPGTLIAKQYNRDPDELLVLLMALRREQGALHISDRHGGWWGNDAKRPKKGVV